ncbi:uncharacterized protein L201_002639 [Kwoniella dendrophila CBS 6074]|uniref:Uncharacterized protein n=1 Tax=Kwoniella dendrophila CBS 6074 TaxID=1295534 RepID=A0AAX4JSZ9_9TREE
MEQDACPQPQSFDSLVKRLESLLGCIQTIINGHSNEPQCARLFLPSLDSFKTRAEKLIHRLFGRDCEGKEVGDAEIHYTLTDEIIREIDDLEDEWWNSEVVACWFGPRPKQSRGFESGIRRHSVPNIVSETKLLLPCTAVADSNDESKSLPLHHIASHGNETLNPLTSIHSHRARTRQIDFNDMSALPEEENHHILEQKSYQQRKKGTQDEKSNVNHSQTVLMRNVGKLRRDSSYVGLNDE